MKTHRVLLAGFAVTVLAAGARGATDYPSMIRFKKGEHPRVWLTKEDLPALRARCAPGGPVAREYARLKASVDAVLAGGPEAVTWQATDGPMSPALLYLVTGERRYAEAAKVLIRGAELGNPPTKNVPVALDWIMAKCDLDTAPGEPLPREEMLSLVVALTSTGARWQFTRENYARSMEPPFDLFVHPFLKPWQYKVPAMIHFAIALRDEWTADDKFDMGLQWVMEYLHNVWVPATNKWTRGVHIIGFDQYSGYSAGAEARGALAWKIATGEDLFPQSVQLREFVRHAFYQRDIRTANWVFYEGGRSPVNADTLMAAYAHANTDFTVRAIAQWVENRRISDEYWASPPGNAFSDPVVADLWQRILWYDPKAPEVDLSKIPTAAHWPGNGYSSFRSGWGPDDTILFFIAGDRYMESQPSYQGHFSIYRKGLLATTSGYGGDPENYGYAMRTIAQNSLLVRDPRELFYIGYGRLKAAPNDGGQYAFGSPEILWGGDWRTRGPGDVYDVGDTVAFESKPLYDYVAGDITAAYRRETKDAAVLRSRKPGSADFATNCRPNKLTRATRQIVFVKPDLFVMFDRVDAVDPSFTKIWLLHTMNEPTIDGKETAKLPAEGAAEYDGSLYAAEHEQGKLLVRRLLPGRAVARKRGGEGFEQWCDGSNRPESRGRRAGWEWGSSWRIEEEPVEKRKDDVFLHVFYACDAGTPVGKMPPCELIDKGDDTGVRVEYAGRTWEITFRRDGGRACAGHIRALEKRRKLVDEALSDKVVPTF